MRTAVVIPCFNDGRFLAESIGSVAAQEQCELVVVDDGSEEPETLRILDRLEAAGTTVIHQANAGLAAARMTGVAATSAPYIHPLDADDQLAPGALASLADVLDANPGAAAAWGSYRTFGATDCHYPTASRLDPWRVTYFNEMPGTSMVRRAAIEAIGGWEHVAYEDWDFWMRLAENGAAGVGIPDVTFLYREHPTARMYAEMLATHDRHFAVLRERHRPLFDARAANRRDSPAPPALKLAVSAVDAIPGLSDSRKRQLWGMARYAFERELVSDCYRGPTARIRDALRERRSGAA